MEVLKDLGNAFRHGWQDVSEGWRDLTQRTSSALTRFLPRRSEPDEQTPSFPRWGLLAGEVVDRGDSVVVQLELPGIERDDCELSVMDGYLRISGEKHSTREHASGSYYLMERAYGGFQRTVRLPADVEPDSAKATLRNGVLKVELKKKKGAVARRRVIEVR